MQNELPNTAQEPVQVNNGLNESPVINVNDLRQRVGNPSQNRLPRINLQALKVYAAKFASAGVISFYNIMQLAKKNKSEEDKNLIPLHAAIVAISAFTFGILARRKNARIQQNQTDDATVALSNDLRQAQEIQVDEELGNQQETAVASIELTAQQTNDPEDSNNLTVENQSNTPENAISDKPSNELVLSNLAAVPEKRIRSNSTTRLDSQISSNESKTRSFSI
ncbi:hypothetical protein [Ascidiimonas sp. W6]|uniref:hypothetical protein n=1 Tax=Ascidiimonas meishanensis TaxID=3128903 RepID=UPI0030EF7DD6